MRSFVVALAFSLFALFSREPARAAQFTAPPEGASSCGAENERCQVPNGGGTVCFGAAGSWECIAFTTPQTVDCGVNVFGDPVAGVVKSCVMVSTVGGSVTPPSSPASSASSPSSAEAMAALGFDPVTMAVVYTWGVGAVLSMWALGYTLGVVLKLIRMV